MRRSVTSGLGRNQSTPLLRTKGRQSLTSLRSSSSSSSPLSPGSPVSATRRAGRGNSSRKSSARECGEAENDNTLDGEAPALAEFQEICSICLEPLDDDDGACFAYPCSFGHRLHYSCSLVYLSSGISFAVYAGADDCCRRRSLTHGLGSGFRAIGAIEEALKTTPHETLKHIACPLCRSEWPRINEESVASTMGQLRGLRTSQLEEAGRKMMQALSRAHEHMENGEDVIRARMTKGLIGFEGKSHTAETFLVREQDSCTIACILSFLRCMPVKYLSAVSRSCRRACFRENKLRVPNLRVARLRTAMHHVSARDIETMEAVAPSNVAAMTAFDVVTCAKWLSGGVCMKELTLSSMQWEKVDPGGQQLAKSLGSMCLRVLDISDNALTDETLKAVTETLLSVSGYAAEIKSDVFEEPRSMPLKTFVANGNSITEEGLASALALGSREGGVTEWGFRHNQLGDAGCETIRNALYNKWTGIHVTGTSWDLRTNKITAKGCEALVPVFEHMVVARLGCNPLGDTGVARLATRISTSLTILDLRQARFGDAGAQAIGNSLMNATSLQEILLSGNNIGPAGARKLADGWAWVASLYYVDLAGNPLGSEGVERIAEEMPCWCQSPFRLSLAGTDCGDEGAIGLKRALDKHPRRGQDWTFELACNGIGSHHIADIRSALDELPPELPEDFDD